MASILVVCTGNICRSPLAEAFLRAALTERLHDAAPRVASAGVIGRPGALAMPETVRAAGERGLDISTHRVRRLAIDDIVEADLVIAMASEHRDAVCDAVPEAASKTYTLKELVRLLERMPGDAAPERVSVDERLRARVAQAARGRGDGRRAEDADQDVIDPLGMPYESYRAVAWELDEWMRRLASALFDRSVQPATAEER
jgi:protein-tyrosine phosphatase